MATKQQISALCKIPNGKTLPILGMVQFTPGQVMTTDLETAVIIKDDTITKTGYVQPGKLKKSGLATIQKHWDLVNVAEFKTEDWPTLEYGDAKIELNQATVSAMLDCLVTVSTDETRPILNCIELKANGTVTSTDSYRLLTKNGGHDLTVNIPRKMVELVKMTKLMDNWHIGDNKEQIVMQNGNVTIVQRKVDGTYPDWVKLAPAKAAQRVTVRAAEVYEALDLADNGVIALYPDGRVMVQDGDKKTTVAIAAPERNVKLNINNMHIVMPLKNSAECVTLNDRYIRDAAGKSEYIRFSFNGSLEPVVVEGIER